MVVMRSCEQNERHIMELDLDRKARFRQQGSEMRTAASCGLFFFQVRIPYLLCTAQSLSATNACVEQAASPPQLFSLLATGNT